MTQPADRLTVPDESAREWKRHREVYKDFGVGGEVRYLENHPGDTRTFLFGLLVAAFTVTADFTLTGYPAAARMLSATHPAA